MVRGKTDGVNLTERFKDPRYYYSYDFKSTNYEKGCKIAMSCPLDFYIIVAPKYG
jgi:hypothetical protein